MNDWSKATSITEFLGLFLNVDKVIIDNVISTIIYLTFIILVVRGGGVDWISFLLMYLVISTVLTFLNISSYLNIIDILLNLIETILDPIIPDGQNIWEAIWNLIKSIFGG
jgi:hypothetical protein